MQFSYIPLSFIGHAAFINFHKPITSPAHEKQHMKYQQRVLMHRL